MNVFELRSSLEQEDHESKIIIRTPIDGADYEVDTIEYEDDNIILVVGEEVEEEIEDDDDNEDSDESDEEGENEDLEE